MRTTTRMALIAGILATASSMGLQQHAFGHDGATGVVKQRMEMMGNLGGAMKALGHMISGKVPFDAGAAEKAAAVLRTHSGGDLTELFPQGSVKGTSEAHERIWDEWAEFEQLADDLELYADALAVSLQREGGGWGAAA
ncbi:cytochrome c [Breoghania sp. L-A4]|uniref:c-type cytochrome n=1 Tax=Breoghania sp. L-A4 TaxID=2304600 RepID=UPI0013C2D009|nr:cytochrome c [Breoghania sp. L-A4]